MAPVDAAAQHVKRMWHWWYLVLVATLSLTPAVWALGNRYGPQIEGPAIEKMVISAKRCEGHDLVAEFTIIKLRGEFYGVTIEAAEDQGPRVLRWRSLYYRWSDRSPSAGLPNKDEPQTVGPIVIEFGCGRKFFVHTAHTSSLGWWMLRGTHGPFGPFGEAPPVTIFDLLQGKYLPPVPQRGPGDLVR